MAVLPPKVIERLRLGRGVAAEITASKPDHRAWIHVEPIVDSRLGHMTQPEPSLEPSLVTQHDRNAISGFRVHRREIHRRYEEAPDDWDLVGLSVDEVHLAGSEGDLAKLLTTWIQDLSTLTLPHNVDDPFLTGCSSD